MKIVSFYKVSDDIKKIVSSELESIGISITDFNTFEDSVIIEKDIPDTNKNILHIYKSWKVIEGLITIVLEEPIEKHIVKFYFPVIKEEIDESTYLELLNRVVIRNNDKNNHGERTALLGKNFCEYLDIPNNEIQKVYISFILHDIGKLGIPTKVLKKTTPLSNSEREIVKQHVTISALFFPERYYKEYRDIIIGHHERMDGSGYPFGIKENENPFFARMLAIIDSYDAMTTRRVYKRTYMPKEAIISLKNCIIPKVNGGDGNLYDKELTEKFIEFIKKRENVY